MRCNDNPLSLFYYFNCLAWELNQSNLLLKSESLETSITQNQSHLKLELLKISHYLKMGMQNYKIRQHCSQRIKIKTNAL